MKTIHFVSLGCPKNRVDSEVMLGVAHSEGYEHTPDPADADVIVINTCGFIDAAKKESVDTILEMADHKEGRCSNLVVAGCLSQRYPEELARDLPEVDHFLGSSDMLRIRDVLRNDGSDRIMVGNPADWVIGASDPRALSSSPGSAYVKIAEGCNRQCSFCVIPSLRGKQRSRDIDDIATEVTRLAAGGVREVNLISQDTIAYGRDQKPAAPAEARSLSALVERLGQVDGLRWIRLFYLYPEKLDQPLIDLIADHPRVVPYIDMPLQHASDPMLRRMRRGHGGDRLRRLVERVRASIPGLTFRTAFIVGHPGETDEEFQQLCDFVTWARFERVGVFRYSDEESCQSNTLDAKVDPELAGERYGQLMEIARDIARDKNKALIGKTMEVLVEGTSDEHEHVQMGRHAGQAPDIDGQVYLSGTEHLASPVRPGEILSVQITQAGDYDLVGEVDSESERDVTPGTKRIALRVLPSDGRTVS